MGEYCIRNPRPALGKAPGHALEANLSTSASLCCVLEVMNARFPSCPLFRSHIAFKEWEFYCAAGGRRWNVRWEPLCPFTT